MANDRDDLLTTGVLLLGGGAAGYAFGRWGLARWHNAKQAPNAPAAPVVLTLPSAPPPAASSSPALSAAAQTTIPSSQPPRAPTSPPTTTSLQQPARPDAKPRAHAVGPRTGPITMPSQLGSTLNVGAGPITSPSQLDPKPIDPYSDSAALGASLAAALVGPSQDTRQPIDPYADASKLIEMPEDYVGRPSSSSGVSARTRGFDRVFERYRGAIPIEYLRALVERESSGYALARTGSAYGLMQIVPVVREDYNKRHGTPYQPEHLFDPSINVGIGCELLRIIIANYRRYHPRIPNLQTNWENQRFVELVTFGWNAGFSEAGGVGRVATYLEKLGAIDITIDLVHEHARTAGASKHLSNLAKVSWCKSVVALYLRERTSARTRTTNLS